MTHDDPLWDFLGYTTAAAALSFYIYICKNERQMGKLELMKQQLAEAVQRLEDEDRVEELLLAVNRLLAHAAEEDARIEEGIRRGREDFAAGRIVPNDEVMARAKRLFPNAL